MSEKLFEKDMENQREMKDGLFDTYKQFKKQIKEKGQKQYINLDLIHAEIKFCETYTKQVMMGIHLGNLLEKQKQIGVK